MSIITLFNGYDNPRKAERVFRDYSVEFEQEMEQEVMNLVEGCHTANELDIALDRLSGHKLVHLCGNHHKNPRGSSLDCGYSNCLRALEETSPLYI